MIIHDLKHPTESLINTVSMLVAKLARAKTMSETIVCSYKKLKKRVKKTFDEEKLHSNESEMQSIREVDSENSDEDNGGEKVESRAIARPADDKNEGNQDDADEGNVDDADADEGEAQAPVGNVPKKIEKPRAISQ